MNKRFYNKDQEHKELKALVDDWVARGGKITQCPPGKARGLPSMSRYLHNIDYGYVANEANEVYLSEGTKRKVPIRYG